MSGHIYRTSQGTDLLFEAIPYPAFDLYVYFNGNGSGLRQDFSVRSADNTTELAGPVQALESADFSGTYDRATGLDDPGNYVLFSGLTAPDFILRSTNVQNGSGDYSFFNGVQIVEAVPEPGSLTLLGMAGLGLLARRRRVG